MSSVCTWHAVNNKIYLTKYLCKNNKFFLAAQVINGQKVKSRETGDVSITSQSSKEVS